MVGKADHGVSAVGVSPPSCSSGHEIEPFDSAPNSLHAQDNDDHETLYLQHMFPTQE